MMLVGCVRPMNRALLFVAAVLCGCQLVPPDAPQRSLPPINAKPYLSLDASGVQVYRCDLGADHVAGWQLVRPSAKLTNAQGVSVLHGAGPSWMAQDGSKVTAKVIASAPSPAAGNIAWLQLVASNDGQPGLLSRTTYIERVNTRGGVANPAACVASKAGQMLEVPYTATYVFYSSK